jgi:hypothetical protein
MSPRNACAYLLLCAASLLGSPGAGAAAPSPSQPHNVILFVPDGLRAGVVDDTTAPAMAALRDAGVAFANSHSVFPTLTTANASALATGHFLGDTGDWANTIYVGFPVENATETPVPFLENDAVLGEMDAHFAGDYLGRRTLMAAAREAGYGTASVGKMGPILIQDHTARDGESTIVIDDATGKDGPEAGARRGIPLSKAVKDALAAAGLPDAPPDAAIPNQKQQDYFTDAFTKAVLPLLKAKGRPFYAVFWSRDPDGTQHQQVDSKGQLVPGINGRFSMAAISNADHDLEEIRAALKEQGLEDTTDIIVAADHGFSTIAKESETSISSKMIYPDVPSASLPAGFLAADLSRQLDLLMFDPDDRFEQVGDGMHSKRGNGAIGADPDHIQLFVAANGGSDLIYLTPSPAAGLVNKTVEALLAQDYVSGIFVRDDLGSIKGALPFSAIGLKGDARTPAPAIVVSFKSFATGCDDWVKCAAEVADTALQQGQGMHGSFSRADTNNFQAAIGPDFKRRFVDVAPTSNADIAMTIAHILKLPIKPAGAMTGRVLTEAFPGGATPSAKRETRASAPAAGGLTTVLEMQSVGETRYFDAAGFPGRTVGLPPPSKP